MTHLHISVPHKLRRSEAETRIINYIEKLKHEYSDVINEDKETWNNGVLETRLNIRGFEIFATVTINEESVEINGDLPAALFLFRGSIKEKIFEEVQVLLS